MAIEIIEIFVDVGHIVLQLDWIIMFPSSKMWVCLQQGHT